jgi:GDP-L-fucose synthase
MYNKILVTGGSGFLGKRLKLYQPDWIYISSREYNLLSAYKCKQMFKKYKPDAVIHLAGRVGGIKDNIEHQADFYYQNIMINTNVIHEAYQAGIKRVLSSLSTCCFPDRVDKYPMTEENIFDGPPAVTNLSYGYTKRMLYLQSISYRKQYGMDYTCFTPGNIFGPDDHFDSENSHFVANLVTKLVNSNDGDTLEFFGTGRALRQQLYVDDLCKIIPILLEKHHSIEPIIVASNENLAIMDMIEIGKSFFNKQMNIVYNGKMDGQFRKDGSNKKLLELIGNFEFTSFEKGLYETIKWFIEEGK